MRLIVILAWITICIGSLFVGAPTEARCYNQCAPVYCTEGRMWNAPPSGYSNVELYDPRCEGSYGYYLYAYCAQIACGTMTGTLYTNEGPWVIAIPIRNRQGEEISRYLISARKGLNAEQILAVVKTRFGIQGELLTLEAFNIRPIEKGCPA